MFDGDPSESVRPRAPSCRPREMISNRVGWSAACRVLDQRLHTMIQLVRSAQLKLVGGTAAGVPATEKDLDAPRDTSDQALYEISALRVSSPSGDAILENVSLAVGPGEAVVIVGPSGSGKSTLLRALFDRSAMEDDGFEVAGGKVNSRASIGLVPQRGAVFDHLDVAGNIAIALRHSDRASDCGVEGVKHWLKSVDLDEDWASSHRAVSQLSGGQAQRLAVARVLASGRMVLFLDEPSVGLDPLRVKGLAGQLRRVCDDNAAGLVVVTHDSQFAVEFADRVLLLKDGALTALEITKRRDAGCRTGDDFVQAREKLDAVLLEALASGTPGADAGRKTRKKGQVLRGLSAHIRPFGVLVQAPVAGVADFRQPRDFFHVLGYALRQSLLRPLIFYAIVSFLLGFTVLYVLASVGGEFGASASIRLVRGLYILALAPPLSAFLFVAASANAVNAWLGGMRLSQQVSALEALGISRKQYLWGPSWIALVIAYIAIGALFAGGLLAGGLALCRLEHVPGAWALLTADLVRPVPERAPYLVRAFALIGIYAVGIASDAVSRGDDPKDKADDVTRAMTRSVVSCTMWVVALELSSLVLLHLTRGGP